MKQKLLLVLLFLAFTPFVMASFLEDIDQHIEDQNIFPSTQFEFEEDFMSDENLESSEIIDEIKSDIFWEEDTLEGIEQKLRASENALWEEQKNRKNLEQRIALLDQEIATVTSQLNEYTARENYHRTLLVRLTRNKAALEATIRIRKRIFERLALRNFLRRSQKRHTQTSGLPRGDFFLTQWLFSSRQLSDVIETYRTDINTEELSKKEIKELEKLESSLGNQEKFLAYQTGVSERLADLIAVQKKRLSTFTLAQIELKNRSLRSEQEQEALRKEFKAQQLESTFVLQDLRLQLKQSQNGEIQIPITTSIDSSQSFGYPVVEPVRITAYFHDKDYEKRFGVRHDGVDFAAPQGSSVLAVNDGKVVEIKDNGLGYSYLILQHADDTFSLYGHVSLFLAREGENILKGQKIALSGGTPGTNGAGYFTTGPHLHFEMFKNGEYVNPLKFIDS